MVLTMRRYLLMEKNNELCEDPEELKCEGEGIISGCSCDWVKRCKKKNGSNLKGNNLKDGIS